MTNTENQKKLMAILAHPDDESFGLGGTLAYYANQGVAVTLVCATRGEAGEVESGQMKEMISTAELRTQELNCAAKILGIKKVIFLEYRDSGMPGMVDNHHLDALAVQAPSDVAEKLIKIIQEEKPDIMITFDPNGGYQHPDHIAIHRATVLAHDMILQRAAQDDTIFQPKKLYYHILERGLISFLIFIMKISGKDPRRMGKNQDIDLMAIADVHYPVHARIHFDSVIEKRNLAAACHASQGGGRRNSGFLNRLFNLFQPRYESFMQAYPSPGRIRGIARDLFN